ncbi:MAG TPA: metallopeptidase TldD-related protein [Thermoanaerobaculia bacterium]|jgi:predicted Zn-dependent protease
MKDADLPALLERQAAGAWELYRKRAESRETDLSGRSRGDVWRREEGWAARWWKGGLRFACGSDRERLAAAIAEAAKLPARHETVPRLPEQEALRPDSAAGVEPPPEMFERLSQLVSEKSRAEAVLASLTLRRGRAVEEMQNAAGLSLRMESSRFDGVARALGRRGSRACETRAVFRWDKEPDWDAVAGRLADGATFPLATRGVGFPRGSWLLDPAVAAAILAAVAPLFSTQPLPRWVTRGGVGSRAVTIVDNAAADAPFDGEGTPTRRVIVVRDGALASRLHDLRSAATAGEPPTGHGVRPSYRTPPRPGPRRLFFETAGGTSPLDLLGRVGRGVFARAATVPVAVDLDRDRYEVEFTGIAIIGGRATEPVAGSRVSGRVSELLQRISAVATDRQFFPMPYPVGAPTVLVERVNFE